MTNVNNTKIISAKTAHKGETVYLTSCDVWSEDVTFAEVLTEDDFGWRLAFSRRLREVVNASSPIHFREVFRTKGPSNRFLGKQAA